MEFQQELQEAFQTIEAWLEDLGMRDLHGDIEAAGLHNMSDVQGMRRDVAQKLIGAAESKEMNASTLATGTPRDKGLSNASTLFADLEKKSRPVMKTIDLDASAHHNELAGKKWSSAYAPPELAALIYEYQQLPTDGRGTWEQYLQELAKERQVMASVTFASGRLGW